MLDHLYTELADGELRLVKLAEPHREALRAACAADAEIWAIYSSSLAPAHFVKRFDTLIGGSGRVPYAVIDGDALGTNGRADGGTQVRNGPCVSSLHLA